MNSKLFGYARVSTQNQNLDRQVEALSKAGIEERDIYVEKQSGKDFNRPIYRNLVDIIMREGDTLIVNELDRLGRNYTEIHEEWHYITKVRGMDIQVLDLPLLDTTLHKDLLGTLISDLILSLLAFMAERERTEKKKLQAAGIAAAKNRGVHMGRPSIESPDNWDECYGKWKTGKITAKKAMEMTGLKKTSFYKLVNTYEHSYSNEYHN